MGTYNELGIYKFVSKSDEIIVHKLIWLRMWKLAIHNRYPIFSSFFETPTYQCAIFDFKKADLDNQYEIFVKLPKNQISVVLFLYSSERVSGFCIGIYPL